jgi:hypothetical protein
MTRIILAASGVALALVGTAVPASAAQLFGRAPSVAVTIPGVTSQAQLDQLLQSQGYSRVLLSSALPNPANPTPQLYRGRDDPQTTPVHEGWNGSAVKDGRTVAVRVRYGVQASVVQMPG